MNMNAAAVIWSVLVLLWVAAPSRSDGQVSTERTSVQIAGTELRRITSRSAGQDYWINIRLPESYRTGDKAYPVLYLMDGDHAFAMATDIVQYLEYGQLTPELIIVSPAYGSKDSPDKGGSNLRNRDLYPIAQGDAEPGAARFLRFLGDELVPYIETHFRVLPGDRTFAGYSLGSSFGWYALFTRPSLFQRYILVDGVGRVFLEMEKVFAASSSALPVKLFVSSGEATRAAADQLTGQLRSRGYHGLAIEHTYLAGANHFAVPAEGLTRGLVNVFDPQPAR